MTLWYSCAQVNEQKERLAMLLGSKDIQLTLQNEMLVRNSYKVMSI